MPRLSKPEANYHLASTTRDRNRFCRDCTMFRAPDSGAGDGRCTLVKGDIHPHGTCNHYEAK
jgi:hypothetical protein